MSSIDRHVSKRLREARNTAGLTQQFVARKLGLTFQQVQKYENASNRISAGRLYQLSGILDVPVGYFFEGLARDRQAKGA